MKVRGVRTDLVVVVMVASSAAVFLVIVVHSNIFILGYFSHLRPISGWIPRYLHQWVSDMISLHHFTIPLLKHIREKPVTNKTITYQDFILLSLYIWNLIFIYNLVLCKTHIINLVDLSYLYLKNVWNQVSEASHIHTRYFQAKRAQSLHQPHQAPSLMLAEHLDKELIPIQLSYLYLWLQLAKITQI